MHGVADQREFAICSKGSPVLEYKVVALVNIIDRLREMTF